MTKLRGPAVPKEFRDDGCSGCAPDGWWRAACRTHDYRYHCLRPVDQYIYGDWLPDKNGVPKRSSNGLVHKLMSPVTGDYEREKTERTIRELKQYIKESRFIADAEFRLNIERIHTMRRKGYGKWRKFAARFWNARMSRIYFFAVWGFGGSSVHGPGHIDNMKLLIEDTKRFRNLVKEGKGVLSDA